ncbi:MAG TPA: tetratricopeptide repeat protein [Steroidobacteraceae bacterium]|nr:tetratricopeptide repeat protein [Steroidobacteraceae bacterium]
MSGHEAQSIAPLASGPLGAEAAVLCQAEEALRAGNASQALLLLRALTAREPTNARLWHEAALLTLRFHQLREAAAFAAAATQFAPGRVHYRLELAEALQGGGDVAQALSHFEMAAELAADDPQVQLARARALLAVGLFEEAARICRGVLAVRPLDADARATLQAALERRCPQPAVNAHALARQLFQEAERLQSAGQLPVALERFIAVLRLTPAAAQVHHRLGNLLQDLGRTEEALAHQSLAARLEPDGFAAAHNAGKLAASLGLVERAREHLGQAHRLRPQDGIGMRLQLLTEAIHDSTTAIVAARARFEAGLDRLLAEPPHIEDPLNKADLPTFYLAYHGQCNRALNGKLARAFALAAPHLEWQAAHCRANRRRAGRIRVGFISRFLRSHSIGRVARGLIAELNRECFEVYVLNLPPVTRDDTARWIQAHCDHWIGLPDTLLAAREHIAALELDVLFYQDIGMEPFSYLLAFARLAKVQCVSYGHPDTTGIPSMDYYVSNDLYEPAGAHAHYSERLVELHDLATLAYYFRPPLPQQWPTRAELGLPGNAHLYVCPQTLFKLHPDFDGLIRRILERDGAGRVVLFSGHCAQWSVLLERRFRRSMGELAERIVFLPRQPYTRYLQLLRVADVVLDTLHFNGMNTSIDALAVGTPVVTLPTGLQRGRFTQAMYRRMGMDEGVIARDAEDYAARAVQLAAQPDLRQALQARIAERSQVLFEDRRAVQEFESFFLKAHLAAVGQQS